MGGSETKPHRSEVFKVEDYEQVEWEPYTNVKDPTFESNFVVLSHKNNPGLQVEKYQLFFNSQAEYISYLETYYERKKYASVVNSVHIEQTTKKNMCSTFHSASVYIERIHFRLFELIEIPLEEGLYIIQVALDGYSKMFQKTGYFKVFSDMIGINKQGKVKVWVNKNFSKNFPDFNRIDHNKSEFEFVTDIIKVIEAHIDFLPGQQKFSDFVMGKKIAPKFDIVKGLLYQYQRNHKIIHQKSMKSIILWIKKNSNKPTVNSSFQQPETDKSDIQKYLKTSSYSTVSERPAQSAANINTANQKKIQFSKLKTRKSNNNNLMFEANKVYLPLQLDHHFNSHPQNRENNNTSLNYLNRDREYGIEKLVHFDNPYSFLPRRERLEQLGQRIVVENSGKFPTKTINKLPSVSFSYKGNELYSPQNIDSKRQQWFGDKKQQKTVEKSTKQKKKDFRKSLNLNTSSHETDDKIKFFSSTGDACQIDPDIARDLYSMTNILKQ